MQINKINLSDGSRVRGKVLSALTKVNDLVSPTLGPDGLSVLIERGMGEPLTVDDGRRTAENIKLNDPIEQLIARKVFDITRKTDEKAGDGTTTSIVLAHAIVSDIFKKYMSVDMSEDDDSPSIDFGNKMSVGKIDEMLSESRDRVLKKIDERTLEVKTKKELVDIATISSGKPDLGKIIGEMQYDLGKEGHITLEFNLLTGKVEQNIVPGYRFTGGIAANWMITNQIRKIATFKEVYVLIAHQNDLDIKKIEQVALELGNAGQNKMVIISPKFPEVFLKGIYATALKSKFAILCVRAPSRKEEAFKDMAIFTGAKFFSKNDDISKAFKKDLGFVEEIEVTEDECQLVGGAGDKSAIKKRIKEVQAEMDLERAHMFKADRLERITALNGKSGVIRIGAPTDTKRDWLKYKIEDARYATKAAYNHGKARGGGLTYKEISNELKDDDILKTALLSPYKKLVDNACGKFTVAKDVYDPALVLRTALINACSTASVLVRIGGAIAYKKESMVEELKKVMSKEDESN